MSSSSNSRLGEAPEEGIKAPVIVESVGPLTLFGEQTVNTVAVVDNDRVLYKDAPDPEDNGIYICKLGNPWFRASDFNAAADVQNGVLVLSVHSSILYQISVSGFWTPNVTPVTFPILLAAGSTGTWGSIVGTLADQTDLLSALDGKIDNAQVLTNVPSGALFTDTIYTHPNHSGDIVSSGDSGTTIQPGVVTFAKMVSISQDTVMGRVSGGSGSPEALTAAQLTSLVNVFTSTLDGTVPLSAGGTTNFLRADGNWTNPTALTLSGLTDVTIVAVADLEILTYDDGTSEWINRTAAEAGLISTAGGQIIGGTLEVTGAIIAGGTVDGRDVGDDGAKLDGIEALAEVNVVDSVFGRTGDVTGEQGDYDSFFLTPSEGNSAYLGIAAKAADSDLIDGVDILAIARTDVAETFTDNLIVEGVFNLPHGSAPGSPVDGDIWTTSAGIFVRINGSTVGPLT